MKSATLASPNAASFSQEAPAAATARSPRNDLRLYALLIAMVLGSWLIVRQGYFKAGDDVGYWLGVAGGVMMLLLFSYPLRKYLRFTHRWGKVKWWFLVHMVLGVGGPMMILLHSTFQLRSVNASVAFISMVIVALSGVAGRFLYVRIHQGLHGELSNLQDLQARAGLAEGEMKLRFRFAPDVAANLLSFEAQALAGGAGWGAMMRRVVMLPMRQRVVYTACKRELNEKLRAIGKEQNWSREQLHKRRAQAATLARRYLASVVRVAQFTAYQRLFALWHVLHVPFVYILIVTALFHVFAVHAY